MSTTPLPSRIKPVRGTCRWVSRRDRVLRINAVHYTVVAVGTRYRLMNWNTGDVHDIDAAGRWCTCPSFVWDHCPVQAGGGLYVMLRVVPACGAASLGRFRTAAAWIGAVWPAAMQRRGPR